ncbi:MAG: phosphatase PAP2 family protein [Patescibacteria group bacterium]
MDYLNYFLPTVKNISIMDAKAENILQTVRSFEWVKIFTWITVLAEWQMIMGFALTASLIFLLWKKKTYIIPLWITIVGSGISSLAGKIIFHRARPESAIYAENTFSFPSAHSMMAMAFFGFIVYILLKRAKKRKYKIIIFCVGLMLILFVGLSRLYLGVHFLSDVLGGYLFGLLWLVAGIVIFERLNLRDKSVSHSPSRMIKIISCILIVIQLIFYAYFAIKESAVPNTRTEPAELAIFDNLAIKLYS